MSKKIRGGFRHPSWWTEAQWFPLLLLVFLLVVVIVAIAGCGGANRQTVAGPVDGGAPSVHGVTWSHAPDTRTPIEAIPWCLDPQGHSGSYPCKWDSRERPAPTWDAQAALVAIWVWREAGCASVHPRIAEDNSVAWACYYGPDPQ